MSDGRLSLFAAGMAEYLLQKQRDGLPEYGEILVGRVSDGGLGLSWRATAVPPAERLCSKMADEDWSVHINDRVQTRIAEEAAQWGSVETGGVLIGRLSESVENRSCRRCSRCPKGQLSFTKSLRLGNERAESVY